MSEIDTFPQVIFVSVEQPSNDEDFMVVHLNKQEALAQGSPVVVGVYKFVEAQKIENGVTISTRRRTRKTS